MLHVELELYIFYYKKKKFFCQKISFDIIHDFIGQPRFIYDIDNVKQKTWEFDGIYNYKFLHRIKEGKIEWKKGGDPGFQLEPKFVAAINERFIALNKFVLDNDATLLLNLPPQPNPVPEGKNAGTALDTNNINPFAVEENPIIMPTIMPPTDQ